MASSSSTDGVPMDALVAASEEKVQESTKKTRRATKSSKASVAGASGEDAVSAGYVVVEAEVSDSIKGETRGATEVSKASSQPASGADSGSVAPVSVEEAVEESKTKGRRTTKAPKAPEEHPLDADSAATAPKKTSKRAKPVKVVEDTSEAPEPPLVKAASRKSRRSSDASGGEDGVSLDVQKPASKRSKAANGEGKAVKKPKILQLDANGEIVDDRVTPIVNKKGVRDSGKASHPDMKMSPEYIKALELKMHREVSDAGDRAKASGRKTWKGIDA
jgi:hypothetical protein